MTCFVYTFLYGGCHVSEKILAIKKTKNRLGFISRDRGRDLFAKGRRVAHNEFGIGTITALRINPDGRQCVRVKFEQEGFKWIMADMEDLQRIEE